MRRLSVIFLALPLLASCAGGWSNPIIRDIYTADPSARVFDGTLYIYPSHDKDNAYTFDMEDYHVFSTRNMKDFKDCGLAFDAIAETSWAHANAWAPDCIERNGKYYLYYPTDKKHIGVAVSSGTNHHSIVKYKGKWYMFYHNADLSMSRTPEAGRACTVRRSVCVDRLYYNPDGTIKKVEMTSGIK